MKVLIVDTAAAGSRGSMAAYSALVESVVERSHRVKRLSLAPDAQASTRWPTALRSRIELLWMMKQASARLPHVDSDLVHITDGSHAHVARWLSPAMPYVVTAHDVIPLLQSLGRFPVASPGPAARWLIGQSVHQMCGATRVVADSESTKRDLLTHAGIDAGKVRVVPCALSEDYRNALAETAGTGHPSPEMPVILHVGNDGFYKNRAAVVRIFARIRSAGPARLVMAGSPPGKALTNLILETGVKGDVSFATDVSPGQLVKLYQAASLLLFPSLYEGFGWPPLEAMATGCPVVCSNVASIPEVVGDAAMTADPADEETLARLCLDVLSDRSLAEMLTERGRARASLFTVARMARELDKVYAEAVGDVAL